MGSVGGNVAVLPKDTSYNSERSQDFYNETGIRLDDRVADAIEGDILQSVLKHVGDMSGEYKDLMQNLGSITLGGRVNSLASTNGERLTLNNAFFGDKNTLRLVYEESVRQGFHPAGTSWEHIVDHEMGHIATKGIMMMVHNGDRQAVQRDWASNSNTSTAGQIVTTAIKQIQDNYRDYGFTKRPTVGELKRDISGYATKNHHETIAEAWADRAANKDNAKPLSREIYRIMMSYGRQRG